MRPRDDVRGIAGGNGFDEAIFYGRGAGKLPTASAVMGDVIEAVKHKVTIFSQSWESSSDNSFVAPVNELCTKWYFRVPADSSIAVEGAYTDENGISFISADDLTFDEAKAKAEEIKAVACIPVLDQ